MIFRNAPPVQHPAKPAGKRQELLLYRRMMDRLWGPFFFLGIILIISISTNGVFLPVIRPPALHIVIGGTLTIIAFSIFAWVSRYISYFRPFSDHLRIVTPFLNLRISYRRIRTIRPTPVSSIFPPNRISWSSRNYLEPFMADTAIVIKLSKYPINRRILNLFFPKEMFLPNDTGLVLFVRDWMEVSTELDGFVDAFRHHNRENQ